MNKSVQGNRDTQIDNIKGILIFLVVFAHLLEVLVPGGVESNPLVFGVYSIIYSFHMPVFVFLSGYLSKKYADRDSWAKGVVCSSLIPFILANTFYWVLASRDIKNFFYPQFAMWYLLSMFFWRIVVYPFSKLRGSLIIALILSVYFGITGADKFLSLQRTVSFFPYFLAGFLAQKETIMKIRKMKISSSVVAFVSIVAVVLLAVLMNVNSGIYTMSVPYSKLDLTNIQGVIFRSIALFFGFCGVFWMISLCTLKRSFITILGENTITVYILHPIFIRFWRYIKLPQFEYGLLAIVLSLLFAVVICLALGNTFVVKVYRLFFAKVNVLLCKESKD